MIPFGNELSPPAGALSDDLKWILNTSFNCADCKSHYPKSESQALDMARQLGLATQIASGLKTEQTQDGGQSSAGPKCDRQSNLKCAEPVAEAYSLIVRSSLEIGVDVVVLGLAALQLLGLVANEHSWVQHIEVLVAPDNLSRLSDGLTRMGCKRQVRHSSGNAVILRTPKNIRLGIHTTLPYVRLVPGAPFVDFDALKRNGLLWRPKVAELNTWTPSPTLIGAQLMAAGLVVNRFSPHGSAFRTIEWVRILGLHRDQNLKHDVFRLIHTDAVFAEYEGVLELARSLEEGIFEGLSPYAKMWLDHAIAASTNRKYRARLIIQNELRRIQFKIGALWIQENLMPMPILGALGECALESMSEWVFSQRELKAKSGCGPSSRQD